MLAKQVTYPSGTYWRIQYPGWTSGCGGYPGFDSLLSEPGMVTRANLISGGVVPDWRKRIVNAESATSERIINHLSVRSVLTTLNTLGDWVHPEAHIYWCNGVATQLPAAHETMVYHTPFMPQYPAGADVIASQLSVSAWSDMTHRLTSMYRDGLLGETLASAHRAVDLIRHPFKRATGLIDAYRRRAERRVSRFMSSTPASLRGAIARGRTRTMDAWGRSSPGRRQWRRLLKVERQLREDWLYYSFGVMNALQDLEAIVRATNREMRKGNVRRVYSRKQATITATSADDYLVSMRYGNVYGSYTDTCDLTHSIVLGVLESQRDQTRRESSLARLGLSAEAFIPTLWAVMPSSWAVDYFFDVDGHIDDWLARKLTIRWGSESRCTRVTRTTSTRATPKYSGAPWNYQKTYASVVNENDIELFTQHRTSVNTIPYKPWTFQFPDRLSQFANLWAVFSPTKRIGVNQWT